MLNITTLNYVWIAVAVVTFFYLLFFKTAPYGRHSSKNWGPTLSNRLGWFFMEFPALVLFITFFFLNLAYLNQVVLIFLVLYCLHYFNRSVIFPLRIKTDGKEMPVIIVLSAILFNTVNTFLIASYLGKHAAEYDLAWLSSWQFILGMSLFIVGVFINQYSDYVLIGLRAPGETGYKIPMGFMFKWISCPNLFGEILEWLGFAVMTWCLPGFTFFIWTCANLIPRAISHHKWYLEKFPNYPKDRNAVLPFIW